MRQLLQLHPHKHTGKVLHHKHTSYHALFLVLGLAGVFMVLLSNAAKAADIIVTGRIPAPIPVGAPVITSPVDGLITTTTPLTVSGTCPVISPAIIITLHDGSDMLGSGQCTVDGTFSISIPLVEHTYSIVATVVTITDDTGESSTPITVTYKLPPPPVVPSKPTTGTSGGNPRPTPTQGEGLEIVSDKPFIVFGAGADAVWSGLFRGGDRPYRVTITWGDGSTNIYNNVGGNKQAFAHHYHQLRGFQINVTVTDKSGHSVSKSFAAATPLIFDNTPNGAGTTGQGLHLSPIILLYALYFALLWLLFTLWRQDKKRQLRPVYVPVRRRKTAKKHK
jgi:hypothetical protein